MSERLEMKKRLIHELAEFLGGTNQAAMSIGLSMGKPEAQQWAKIRRETPLRGYPTVEEAEAILTDLLG